MTAKDLLKILRKRECIVVRQRGSHITLRCGKCQGVVPLHTKDLAIGTLKNIEKRFEPCLGRGWLKKK